MNFEPGELVDITIRGARVMGPKPGHDNVLTLGYAETQPGVYACIDLGPAAMGNVAIERVAPAEWPPVAGDLWRDSENGLWFARYMRSSSTGSVLTLTSAGSGPDDYYQRDRLLSERGPLTLVHREHPKPGEPGE